MNPVHNRNMSLGSIRDSHSPREEEEEEGKIKKVSEVDAIQEAINGMNSEMKELMKNYEGIQNFIEKVADEEVDKESALFLEGR